MFPHTKCAAVASGWCLGAGLALALWVATPTTASAAATARRVTSPSELPIGPNAQGQVGDYLLEQAKRNADFIGVNLDVEKVASVVDSKLDRNRV